MGTHPDSVTKDAIPTKPQSSANLPSKNVFVENYNSSIPAAYINSKGNPSRPLKGGMDSQIFVKYKKGQPTFSHINKNYPAKQSSLKFFTPKEFIPSKPKSKNLKETRKLFKANCLIAPTTIVESATDNSKELDPCCSTTFSESLNSGFGSNNQDNFHSNQAYLTFIFENQGFLSSSSKGIPSSRSAPRKKESVFHNNLKRDLVNSSAKHAIHSSLSSPLLNHTKKACGPPSSFSSPISNRARTVYGAPSAFSSFLPNSDQTGVEMPTLKIVESAESSNSLGESSSFGYYPSKQIELPSDNRDLAVQSNSFATRNEKASSMNFPIWNYSQTTFVSPPRELCTSNSSVSGVEPNIKATKIFHDAGLHLKNSARIKDGYFKTAMQVHETSDFSNQQRELLKCKMATPETFVRYKEENLKLVSQKDFLGQYTQQTENTQSHPFFSEMMNKSSTHSELLDAVQGVPVLDATVVPSQEDVHGINDSSAEQSSPDLNHLTVETQLESLNFELEAFVQNQFEEQKKIDGMERVELHESIHRFLEDAVAKVDQSNDMSFDAPEIHDFQPEYLEIFKEVKSVLQEHRGDPSGKRIQPDNAQESYTSDMCSENNSDLILYEEPIVEVEQVLPVFEESNYSPVPNRESPKANIDDGSEGFSDFFSDLTSEDGPILSHSNQALSSEDLSSDSSVALSSSPCKLKTKRQISKSPELADRLILPISNFPEQLSNSKSREKSPKGQATKKTKHTCSGGLDFTDEPKRRTRRSKFIKITCETELEVEMILARKQSKRKTYYRIKWKGYSDDHNTWEPSEMLSCDEFIQAFEAAIENNALVDYWTSIDIDGSTVITLPPNIRSFIELFSQDEGPVVSVFNEIDDSGPPQNFTAINQNLFRDGVIQPIHDSVGCDCKHDCRLFANQSNCTCNHTQATNSVFPTYSFNGLLKFKESSVIYECNSRCACPPSCKNRTVQNGRQVKIQIFKTREKGWGVRALQKIKKGSFIMEYVGEVITSDEAERRGVLYDARQATYLFDMDYEHGHAEDCSYTIDSCFFGNSSHFFNHSCDPNLAVFPVFIESYSIQLYQLGFFAKKDIAHYEELTFDYLPQAQGKSSSGMENSLATKYKCFCQSKKCRGYFHI